MTNSILDIKNLSVSYTSSKRAVTDVTTSIERNKVTAIMGPSGCGKSTLLRAINLMHNIYPNIRVEGEIVFNGSNLLQQEPMIVRRNIGMVFQRPNPFPTMSIADNVLAGYMLNGIKLSKAQKGEIVERELTAVGLWDEVKDVTKKRGTFLSGGQMQRLCIARALALRPKVLLMDEPTSALDPIATQTIEKLITELKNDVTIVIVTHNMGQAMRVSNHSLFMYLGELVESGSTEKMFSTPDDPRTREYLLGKIS
ncbi:MAG: phosphate ABC transporter ATP-binding protein [Marinilabiliaceae bacterium]|nr:phosphate ABC transporter ATP-binding protein [Marinilabiliaceae bacterium]